ncbi:PIG-L deacetylase family protein [Naasia sp. SYSU D00057]|uniref:PIG-L deacetylase family protein n=1 Tax=Naasia sp. SYSU D00057 TaxID=2817380 RepID=UPI001B3143C7|nr:PIG-L deacetylase family protein [Naasia sp. SYSU D00057]
MFWLGSLLATLFVVIAVGVATHDGYIRRHYRHPRLLIGALLTLSILAIPLSVGIALTAPEQQQPWVQYAIGALFLTLPAIVALGLHLRHSPRLPARQRRVLAVGAHPDDLELACGASLARFVDEGHEVMAMVMSHGDHGGIGEEREREALRGAELLGLEGVTVRDFTDTRMAEEISEIVGAVEVAIELFKPDIILTHSAHDQHQDHHAVHLATMRAARHSPTILCFESPSVTQEFRPNFFVDVSEYLESKVSAVQMHRDQSGKPYMGAKLLRGAAVFRGRQGRIPQAEGFEVMRALSSDLGEL